MAYMQLPDETAAALRALVTDLENGGDPGPAEGFMANLVAAGWGYACLGDTVGWPRNRAYHYANKVPAGTWSPPQVPAVPEPPEELVRGPRRPLEPEQAAELKRLQKLAIGLRGWHPDDDPRRAASEELSKLIDQHTRDGVTYKSIGAAIGVRPQTVRARLKRHGLRKTNPSLTAYRAHREES